MDEACPVCGHGDADEQGCLQCRTLVAWCPACDRRIAAQWGTCLACQATFEPGPPPDAPIRVAYGRRYYRLGTLVWTWLVLAVLLAAVAAGGVWLLTRDLAATQDLPDWVRLGVPAGAAAVLIASLASILVAWTRRFGRIRRRRASLPGYGEGDPRDWPELAD